MKTELSLQEIKKITFDILKHFKVFCQDNNLTFYLSNGTLLGAVKYKGFIPWDDDIDVFLPREDYNRLIELYKDSDRYKLFSIERDSNFKFSFAKLCDMNTIKEEFNIDNGIQLGVDIDIFPLDYCTEHILKAKVQNKLQTLQKSSILSKFISSDGKPFYKRCIINYCKKKGFEYFYNKLRNLVISENQLGNTYCGCLMWPVYGEREIISSSVFSDSIEVEFEGEKFPAPIGFDVYLRSLYGDYKQDPPLEKQKTHHLFKAYRICI